MDTKPHMQEAQKTQNNVNTKMTTPSPIIVKLQQIENKRENLEKSLRLVGKWVTLSLEEQSEKYIRLLSKLHQKP